MKALTITAGLMLTVATAMGQQPTNERPYLSTSTSYAGIDLHKAGKNFLAGLNNSNDGVVESVIAQLAYMREAIPQGDRHDIEATVNKLVSTGRTPVIRYKAYLASQVFGNPGLFTQLTANDYASPDEFFAAVSHQLQQTLLGYNGE